MDGKLKVNRAALKKSYTAKHETINGNHYITLKHKLIGSEWAIFSSQDPDEVIQMAMDYLKDKR